MSFEHLTGRGLPKGPNVPDRRLQTGGQESPSHGRHIAPTKRERRANTDSQLRNLSSISPLMSMVTQCAPAALFKQTDMSTRSVPTYTIHARSSTLLYDEV